MTIYGPAPLRRAECITPKIIRGRINRCSWLRSYDPGYRRQPREGSRETAPNLDCQADGHRGRHRPQYLR
jgi:hypothetical protein